MPAKVQYEQAKSFVKAFPAGQPRKATIASTLVFAEHVAARPLGRRAPRIHA